MVSTATHTRDVECPGPEIAHPGLQVVKGKLPPLLVQDFELLRMMVEVIRRAKNSKDLRKSNAYTEIVDWLANLKARIELGIPFGKEAGGERYDAICAEFKTRHLYPLQ
jgi:hypothetical protein